jgi:hypothetical protein
VGFLSYPECYPCQWRAGMALLGIGWAHMSRLVTLGTIFTNSLIDARSCVRRALMDLLFGFLEPRA